MRIAREYGERLKSKLLKPGALDKLVQDYPSHGFVIDKEEALQYFTKIEDLTPDEASLGDYLEEWVRWPQDNADVFDVSTYFEYLKELENRRARATAEAAAAQAAQKAAAAGAATAPDGSDGASKTHQEEDGHGAQSNGGGDGAQATQPAGQGAESTAPVNGQG